MRRPRGSLGGARVCRNEGAEPGSEHVVRNKAEGFSIMIVLWIAVTVTTGNLLSVALHKEGAAKSFDGPGEISMQK